MFVNGLLIADPNNAVERVLTSEIAVGTAENMLHVETECVELSFQLDEHPAKKKPRRLVPPQFANLV